MRQKDDIQSEKKGRQILSPESSLCAGEAAKVYPCHISFMFDIMSDIFYHSPTIRQTGADYLEFSA